MSWFSLVQAEKTVVDSHHFFKSFLTGQFIGHYAVDSILNKSQTYVKTKEAVASFFSNRLSPPFDPLSAELSEKLLERLLKKKKFYVLFPNLSQKIIANDLQPLCQKAIKKGFKVLLQKGVESGIDAALERSISIAVIAGVYQLGIGLLGMAHVSKNSPVGRSIEFMQTYLPKPATTLASLTAIHAAEMILIFWKTQCLELKNTDLNKKQVKQLIQDYTQEPIKNSLKDKLIYRAAYQTIGEENINAFIALIISEIINSQWENMHNIRFLNLPLVT